MTASNGKQPQNRHTNAASCHHFTVHFLTCDEYDGLRERAGGRCEICRTPEEETGGKRLVVDHDGRSGMGHLVRGLVCDRCNAVMACVDGRKRWGANRRWETAARAFAANSWQQPTDRQRQILAAYERKIHQGVLINYRTRLVDLRASRPAIATLSATSKEGTAAPAAVTPRQRRQYSAVDQRAKPGDALTAIEADILRRIAAGAYDAEIARHLVMSTRNYRRHAVAAQRKLGARTRAHAVVLALRAGLISIDREDA